MKISIKFLVGFSIIMANIVTMIRLEKYSPGDMNSIVEELAEDKISNSVAYKGFIESIYIKAIAARDMIIFSEDDIFQKVLRGIIEYPKTIDKEQKDCFPIFFHSEIFYS